MLQLLSTLNISVTVVLVIIIIIIIIIIFFFFFLVTSPALGKMLLSSTGVFRVCFQGTIDHLAFDQMNLRFCI